MSLLAASLAIVLFSGFAVAQISAPNCSLTWRWSFNSLGQDPCTVTAYMMSTCNGGSFNFGPLEPGYSYVGPSGDDDSNLCKCSTVGYSLVSACGGCQGEEWITWSEFITNCTRTLPPSSFPNPIPSGTRVPQWALLDVINENDWDFNKSYTIGDSPELGPGTIPGSSTSSAPLAPTSDAATSIAATSNTATSNTTTPIPVGRHSSNAGGIAGGIVGGLAAISILVALLLYLRRRRSLARSAAPVRDIDPHMDQVQWTMSNQETATSLPETANSLMKRYDPGDPTTFPQYQGAPSSLFVPAQASPTKNLYTVATMPSPPAVQAQGYHGLPVV